jgi:hypothetical protein
LNEESRRATRGPSRWKRFRQKRALFWTSVVVAAVVVLLIVMLAAASVWPDLGAKGTAAMRVVLGDRITAKIEGAMLSTSDWIHGIEYSLGIGHNRDPLGSTGSTASTSAADSPQPTIPGAGAPSVGSTTSTTGAAVSRPPGTATSPTFAAEPPFRPAPLPPMGSLDREGQWQPFITDQYQRVVAYRTALQPDKSRGYAHAVIVAIDLRHTRLHFVLGYEEPVSPNQFARPGIIPTQDYQAGVLLAAFNGGFQAKHGQFGAMADGQVALPAREGLGTLVIYKDGSVAVGAWGTDIQSTPNAQSWRQNGPLMVTQGTVNPHTSDFAPKDWGYVFGGGVATFRSGVGISRDRQTLYVVVGPSLTTSSLAAAMAHAGIWNGIQLDINRPWTRFDKAIFTNGKLGIQSAVDGVAMGDTRLFNRYKRDFFYITTGAPPA